MNRSRNSIRIIIKALPFVLMLLYAIPSGAQHVMDLNKVPPDFKVRGPGNDYFGFSLASGDVNGDGIDDLIVGDLGKTGGVAIYPGGVWVFFGRKFESPSTVIELSDGLPDLGIVGVLDGGECGWSVACGDVNGDGNDDMIVCDPTIKGKIYVIYGRTDFLPNQFIDLAVEPADLTIYGRYGNADLGISVGLTDFNGDGLMDIVAGDRKAKHPRKNSWPGAVILVYGSDSYPPHHVIDLETGPADLEIYGESNGEQCGYYVAGGDINGDGYGDILMGAPTPDWPDFSKGHVYAYFGEPSLPQGTVVDFSEAPPPVTIVGEDYGNQLGRVESGDLNGDGFDELICAAPLRSVGGYYCGRVYVIKGRDTFTLPYKRYLENDPADLTVEGSGKLGNDMACGDASGDGLMDLVMGNPNRVEVIFGDSDLGNPAFIDLTLNLPDIHFIGTGKMGEAVDACDINGDGFKDVVGSSKQDSGEDRDFHGSATVLFAGGAKPYGEGFPGSGGIVPALSNEADGLPVISTGNLELTISNGLGGASGLLLFSLGKGSYPSYGGTFLLDPSTLFQMLPVTLSNPGGGPGTGELSLPLTIPNIPELNITPIYLQVGLIDSGAACGVSLTPGLQISFLSKGE